MGTALCGFYVARHMDIMMERVHSPKSSSCVCENPSIMMMYVFHTCSDLVHNQLLIWYYAGTVNRHKGIIRGEARSSPPGCCHFLLHMWSKTPERSTTREVTEFIWWCCHKFAVLCMPFGMALVLRTFMWCRYFYFPNVAFLLDG